MQQRTAAASAQVTRSEDRVGSAGTLQEVASAVRDAKSALDSARRAGNREAIRSLERKVANLVQTADRKSSESSRSRATSMAIWWQRKYS